MVVEACEKYLLRDIKPGLVKLVKHLFRDQGWWSLGKFALMDKYKVGKKSEVAKRREGMGANT